MTHTKLTSLLFVVALACTLSACDIGGVTQPETGDVAHDAGIRVAARIETMVEAAPPDALEAKAMAPAADLPADRVRFAAVLAREISAAPEQADKILRKHGLDRDELDAMMFAIAGDPVLTEAYMRARRSR